MKKAICSILIISIIFSMCIIPAAAFSDVSSGDWFAQAVEYVVENGLFQGTSTDTFTPHGTMTRGMFVTVLGRMANAPTSFTTAGIITKSYVNMRSEPTTESDKLDTLDKDTAVEVLAMESGWYKVRANGKTGYIRSDLMAATIEGFTDVPYDMYYTPYISWAYQCGIATGMSTTSFAPNSPITREDICVYLKRYCDYYGIELPVIKAKLTFTDESLIGDLEAVQALQQAGIINGRDTGAFDPAASVTRCEVAALFQRYGNAEIIEPDIPSVPTGSYKGYELFGNIPPKTAKADPSYFDDACFIGHSLVVGMKNYFSLPDADYYAVSGISASRMLEYDRFPLEETYIDEEGNEQNAMGTIGDVLEEKSYGKVYVMLGVNELGPEASHVSSYYNSMTKLVKLIKDKQPKADIYLISITPIGEARCNISVNFTRENALIFNEKLQQVSVEQDVYYLDAFGEYANANGYMPDDCVTSDGIHLLGSKYKILKELILTHAL